MGLIELKSNLITSLSVAAGKTYYLKVEQNNNEILMNVLNATQFFNLTDKEIKIFSDDSFVNPLILTCDKFYWYNQNKTQLKYDYILQNGDIIVFKCINSGIIGIGSNVDVKKYNRIQIKKLNPNNAEIKIYTNTCGYNNADKLSELNGNDAPIGQNFNNICFDYESFQSNCLSLGLEPNLISQNLNGINFFQNYIIIRARSSSSISADLISDLGNGIIEIKSPNLGSGVVGNFYRFFKMCKLGWKIVRFYNTDYFI